MRILIGSCGGLTGSYLARKFKEISEVYVIGADVTSDNVTRFFVDEFYTLPLASDACYIKELVKLLINHEIDAYLPTHSKEIKVVSKHEEEIKAAWNGNLLVSPYDSFEELDDKSIANYNLKKLGIPVPQMYLPGEIPTIFPVFVKPNIGSGSSGSFIINSKDEYIKKKIEQEGFTAYELIKGKEFTVDCIFDAYGKLIAYNQRERIKNMGGAVIITKNNYEFDIEPFIRKIADKYCFEGCVNFQYILRENTPYFIDVNLRYASGGLPLTIESGINIPQIIIDIWNGVKTFDIESCPEPNKTMYRYFCEIYE